MSDDALIEPAGFPADPDAVPRRGANAGPHAGPNGGFAIERRREPRNETNWIAVIRFLDGTEIPCNVKDVSRSGAKLGVPETVTLPVTFMVKVLGYDFLCLVRLVWRRGNHAGVQIERIGKRPPGEPKPAPAPEPQDEPAETYTRLGTRRSRFSSF